MDTHMVVKMCEKKLGLGLVSLRILYESSYLFFLASLDATSGTNFIVSIGGLT